MGPLKPEFEVARFLITHIKHREPKSNSVVEVKAVTDLFTTESADPISIDHSTTDPTATDPTTTDPTTTDPTTTDPTTTDPTTTDPTTTETRPRPTALFSPTQARKRTWQKTTDSQEVI